MNNRNKSKKILVLFLFLIIGFMIFLSAQLYTVFHKRPSPSLYTSNESRAERGEIISADGFHIATTQQLYKAVVNTRNIDPDKKELFIKLFSIYSGISEKKIRKKLSSRRGSVVLSYHINPQAAQYLKSLAYRLRRMKVFVEYIRPNGRTILHGLSILPSGENRQYPYKDLLTPIVGYIHKVEDNSYTRVRGVKGIEKSFDDVLHSEEDGKQFGPRDVNNYMILNKKSFTRLDKNGLNVQLSIPVTLQSRVEDVLSKMKKKLKANEIMAVVMESSTGKIISMASSNRFKPNHIKRSDYPSLNSNVVEYSFEPGSVLKPIIFSLLLEEKLVNPYDLVNGHNGRFKIGRKTITDEHKFQWLSAENVIVHSSNIGIAQLAQRLPALEYYQGLIDFGFAQKSGIQLPYEKRGSVPAINRLKSEIYKATASYGYGLNVNVMQLLKAYNVFNNRGRILQPYFVEKLIDMHGNVRDMRPEGSSQIISSATAERMKKILIKTVEEGTGQGTIISGLQIGGKTGTAHIAEKGKYVRKYNTSFFGFANDSKSAYTIGVTVVQPRQNHFASLTAVPTYKQIVELLIEFDYLRVKAKK
ncbi:penicillin-binding protein 2 [Sulfurimonas sp. MAG313]|nr:penicillin-binding protein 2 [Sulfurimonas sp. MAG313]MDF1880295.1 penicillin-binding protein 2 [Sulfurimonas sp. MAG313]